MLEISSGLIRQRRWTVSVNIRVIA
jgi:hypothetical protein